MPDVTISEALDLGTDTTGLGLEEPVYAEVVNALCSPLFHHERVHGDDFEILLDNVIEAATALDDLKKVLFYGRLPAQPAPTFSASFAYERVHPDIVHAIVGIITEAGELAERLLKMGKEPNEDHRPNLVEESGDLGWYVQLLRNRLAITSSHERLINARKLFKRYPEKVFAATRAAERNLAAEAEVLKDG